MTRPNEFTWAPTQLKWRHKGESRKQDARMWKKPTSSHNLSFFIRARVPGCTITLSNLTKWIYTNALKRRTRTSLHGHPRTTCSNEFTWIPSNDPPKLVYGDAPKWPTWTSLHRHPQMTHPNEFTRTPSKRPTRQVYMGAPTTETKAQGRVGKTSYTNVDKDHPESQLIIFDTGSCA